MLSKKNKKEILSILKKHHLMAKAYRVDMYLKLLGDGKWFRNGLLSYFDGMFEMSKKTHEEIVTFCIKDNYHWACKELGLKE